MADRLLRSTLDVEVRSIDVDKRQATFVASTENPVKTWGDPEVLRMSGIDLTRYEKNPVLLDTHGRYGLDSVIGSCSTKIQGRKLYATATYADTERGENAWRLVRDGHVRAMSIGYSVNPKKVTRLGEGSFDGEGAARVKGPCTIANEWQLLEISNVPVPADEDAVRRDFYQNILKENLVADNQSNRGVIDRAMASAQPAEVAAVAIDTPVQTAPVRAVVAGQGDMEEERAARRHEALRRSVAAITPRGLEGAAEDCLLRGLDLAQTRAKLLEAQAARYQPVGTLEPSAVPTRTEIEARAAGQAQAGLPDYVTDEVLVRGLENLSI